MVPAKLTESTSSSLRERNKLDKLQRIRDAAKTLFETQGYEGTTLRDVAKLANVGLGTVFFYAPNKSELVFMVVNDEHALLPTTAFADVDSQAPILEQLMVPFYNGFRFLLRQGVIGRFMLRELTFDPVHDLLPQETRFNNTRLAFMQAILEIVERGQRCGEVRADVDAKWAVRVLFAIFRSETRIEVSKAEPSLEEGLAALQRSLSLVLNGLAQATLGPN